jgi:protein-S-isoprenylcysteine O-methyltransferase Ste14
LTAQQVDPARFYSHEVRTIGDHQVIDRGPHRLLRHPAYLVVWRIRVEEPVLMRIPGYPEYARLIPGLW